MPDSPGLWRRQEGARWHQGLTQGQGKAQKENVMGLCALAFPTTSGCCLLAPVSRELPVSARNYGAQACFSGASSVQWVPGIVEQYG
jgi:hypothetical protein